MLASYVMMPSRLQAQIERLKHALEIHRQGLESLESALLEFEEGLLGESSLRPKEREGLQLLSMGEVCQELGMGKTWVYKRIRSGQLRSVKLGHNIKVRRQDLERYLEEHTFPPPVEEEILGGGEDPPPPPST